MAYIETPRTDAGNATFMTNNHDLDDFSVEHSMISPIKKSDDIIALMRNERGTSLKTPRARLPLADRRNLPAISKQAEFTPLLQSVTKKNFERNSKRKSGPETPAFLRNGGKENDSPALPTADGSVLYGSDFGSSVLGDHGSTPIPQIISSSAQSTPLAALPKRDATGVLNDQGQLMTLREQENIIDKVEKENFGLKLKIHFLEEALRKSGPGFNEAALRENTDLKVDRITLQKDLAKCRKTLTQAERDIEAYKRHLEGLQAKAQKDHADQSVRKELEQYKLAVRDKEEEVEELRDRLDAKDMTRDDLQRLKDDIEDLEADVRAKDRQIEEKEDEIDRIRSQAKKDSDELEEVCAELEEEKKRVQELEAAQQTQAGNTKKLEEALEDLEDAQAAQRKAENDLDKLQEEISNKSFTTKGLTRQIEEKNGKMQDEISELRGEQAALQASLEAREKDVQRLEEELQSRDNNLDSQSQQSRAQQEALKTAHDEAVRKHRTLEDQLKKADRDLENKIEEKDLLHSRHDALTAESNALQKDLTKACAQIEELERGLQDEREHAEENDKRLRAEAKDHIASLTSNADSLQRELEEQGQKYTSEKSRLDDTINDLQSQKRKLEEQTTGLQRTISKLRETEGTLSGKEIKMQEALESENQRHRDEEAILDTQVQGLKSTLEETRHELTDVKTELLTAKEDLAFAEREQERLEDKVQELEEEVEVLLSEREGEDADQGRVRLESAERDVQDLNAQIVELEQKLEEAEAKVSDNDDNNMGHFQEQLRKSEGEMRTIKAEKQALQDRLATNSLELQNFQSKFAAAEAEREELRSQLGHIRSQADDTFKLDQERIDLRTSKMRLEAELDRLRDERKTLISRNEAVEKNLDSEISRASAEEARLQADIDDLKDQLSLRSSSKTRELSAAKQSISRLESRIEELQNARIATENDAIDRGDLSLLEKQLATSREKESDFLRREVAQKDVLRDLKAKVTNLERQQHEAEIARLSSDSPKSSTAGSARRNELLELQHQLRDAQQQVREARRKAKEDEKSLQQRFLETERKAHNDLDSFEQQREQLEADISALRHEHESLQSKNASANQTITRLRTRISSLEQDFHSHRQLATADNTIAEERADLHEMLKDAQLQAEDLQIQITARDASLSTATTKEKDLRSQLRRVREERNVQTQKSSALTSEIDTLQARHERAVDRLASQQKRWEEEKKVMMKGVRFANMDTSSLLHDGRGEGRKEMEKRHAAELRGLGKQIQWLRAKCKREEGFRSGLVLEKQYLSLQISMFEACNKVDLEILRSIGCDPATASPQTKTRLRLGDAIQKHVARERQTPRPTLKGAALAVIAAGRMRKMAEEWSVHRANKQELVAKAQRMMLVGQKRHSVGAGGR